MQWIDFPSPQVAVRGQVGAPRALLHRLPDAYRDAFPVDTWERLTMAAGIRLAFETDSPLVALRIEYLKVQHPPGFFDVYLDGHYCSSFAGEWPGTFQPVVLNNLHGAHSVELYMPSHCEVRLGGIGIGAGAQVAPPAAHKRPLIVFHGDSITHGSRSRRAGTTYPARVARVLDAEFINLGVGGTARGEPGMAAAIAAIPAEVVVLAFGVNTYGSACDPPNRFETIYDKFLGSIRAAQPHVPIVVVTPLFHARETLERNACGAALEEYRRVIRQVVLRRESYGDRHLVVVEGFGIIGPGDEDRLADHVHPNDQGFAAYADRLVPVLRRILTTR